MENTVSFQEYLLSKGYLFDPKIIENYLLSIKVKPFVIFTGNSGTGKTKLSQLFAEYISDSTQNSGNNSSLINDNEFLSVKVPVNKSSFENTGWTLSNKYLYDVLPIKESQCDCDMWVDNIHAKAYVRVQMQLEYDKNNEKLKNYFKNLFSQGTSKIVDLKINVGAFKEIYDCKSNNENFIILEQNSNKTAFNERQWFMNNNIFNYLPFKSGYVGCNIVVEDIKSTAKIRLMPRLYFKKNKELQDYLKENEGKKVEVKIKTDNFNFDNFHPIWEKEKDDSTDYKKDPNYKIVPVGANWTENRHVLGFYNVITEEYNETPSYSLIKASKNDISSPYFLILDEMNLSHVERYFADFLSAIESGQPIPLYSNDDENYELDIPDNLLIVGTVNVDETTYMFSPKVLDRANTIEFPTMAAKEYMNSDFKEFDFKNINYLMNPLEDLDVRNMNVYDLKDIFMFINCSEGNLWDVLSNELDLFQSILKKINFDFGFRVINEILRFMFVSWRYEDSPQNWENWERYFDAQVKQKILPKLHGSQKAIGQTINELFNACLIERKNNADARLVDLTKDDCRYYTSAVKLQNMAKILSNQRYVSFIN
jgi:energy-coupling factor transporter ATP-binding protein EcfA2